MKKLYMHTIAGSCERDCFNYLISPLYGSKIGLSECNLFWVCQGGGGNPPSMVGLEILLGMNF